MNGLKKVDIEGYEEIGRLEFSKELVFTLIGMCILALFAFGYLFFALYALFTGKESGMNITLIPAISLFIGTLILHELVHGFFVSKYGGKPRYSAGIYFILPYFYTTTKTIFSRNQVIIICIAPLLVISIAGVAAMAAFPTIAHFILIPLIVNASGSVGDLWMIRTLLRYPEQILAEDKKFGLIIYGRGIDKPMNVPAGGFGSKFLKGFMLSLISLVILLNILSMVLDLTGTESFTIGPQNSPYTIFEYSSPKDKEGFFSSLIIFPVLSISGVAGLVYTIFTAVYKRGS